MKRNRIAYNSRIYTVFCVLGFHLLFLGMIFLFGYLLPKCCISFPWFQIDLVIFSVMLFILYYFRFTQIKLWMQFFLGMPHIPLENVLESILSKVLYCCSLLKKHVFLLCLVYFSVILVFIMFMFLSSVITLLVEVYWLTDFSLVSNLPFYFMVCFMIVSELFFVILGWLSSIKETYTNEKQVF